MNYKLRALGSIALTLFLASGIAAGETPLAPISEEQIRQLIRQAAEKDIENDKAQRNYTYIQREEERRLGRKGEVKSTGIRTYEIMVLFEEPVRKLITRDDKPLSEKEARKEEQKIQKIIDKRRNESERDRQKRLEKQDENREKARRFVREIADAYNFRYIRTESLFGHETYVVDADPRPGFQPRTREAKMLPKFRFRAWIDKSEMQWLKLDVQCIETVSVGLFLVRLHKGSNIQIEQTRVNDEVWLPKHVSLKLDARIALFKGVNLSEEISFREYRKFRTDTKIVPLGEAP